MTLKRNSISPRTLSRTHVRSATVTVLLTAIPLALCFAGACGNSTEATPDSGVIINPQDSAVAVDTGIPSETDSGPAIDGGALKDAAVNYIATCKDVLAANPSAPSGLYSIDLDGPGSIFAPLQAYCDMSFDGGGWTLIQSYTGKEGASALSGADDAGVIVHTPQPGFLGGFSGAVVKELANRSAQVHIRRSFDVDSGTPDAGLWVTSRVSNNGGATQTITNLRGLNVLTKDTDGGFEDWSGPAATAAKLAWAPQYGGGPGTCLNPVQLTKYPSIYWACGNFDSMNIYAPQGIYRWTYSPTTVNEPMEVYVR